MEETSKMVKKEVLYELIERCSRLKTQYSNPKMHNDIDESKFWESLKDFVKYTNDRFDNIRKLISLLKPITKIKTNIDNLKRHEHNAFLA